LLRDKTLGVVDELEGKWRPLPSVRLHSVYSFFEALPEEKDEVDIVYVSSSESIELYRLKKHDRAVGPEVLFSHEVLKYLLLALVSLTYRKGMLVLVFTEFLLWVDCRQNNSREGPAQQRLKSALGNANNLLTAEGKNILLEIFGDKVVFFEGFKIERDDLMSKTSSANKYRNFYTLGWLEGAVFFSNR
jgi:hypothetical protein